MVTLRQETSRFWKWPLNGNRRSKHKKAVRHLKMKVTTKIEEICMHQTNKVLKDIFKTQVYRFKSSYELANTSNCDEEVIELQALD
mmetsp:Transcript_6951/g.10861  ORF Transcript_6951/g.10861 Transcript_6951/m.10861 type:complete len:86 (+) Transcript_6951:1615-1872(+)